MINVLILALALFAPMLFPINAAFAQTAPPINFAKYDIECSTADTTIRFSNQFSGFDAQGTIKTIETFEIKSHLMGDVFATQTFEGECTQGPQCGIVNRIYFKNPSSAVKIVPLNTSRVVNFDLAVSPGSVGKSLSLVGLISSPLVGQFEMNFELQTAVEMPDGTLPLVYTDGGIATCVIR